MITLPVVVLIAFLAQPQLFFAMAQDGLLPGIFARTNKRKTLVWGTAVSGISMTVIAVCVPFSNLGYMISAGVLLSFNMSKSSIAPARPPPPHPFHTCTSPFAHHTPHHPVYPLYPHTFFPARNRGFDSTHTMLGPKTHTFAHSLRYLRAPLLYVPIQPTARSFSLASRTLTTTAVATMMNGAVVPLVPVVGLVVERTVCGAS